MKVSLNKKVFSDFTTLVHALGVDENDLMDYLNWCLLEHLVMIFSTNKEWINRLKSAKDGMAEFKKEVEIRTKLKWDVDNIIKLYDRVCKSTEAHYRQPITYEELLRLLINTPMKCSNADCGKTPPDVKLHIDHTFPASKGGNSKYENLRYLCEKCNLSKSNKITRSGIWIALKSLQPF